MIARLVATLFTVALLLAGTATRAADGPTDDEVARAIAKGVAFLKERQTPAGNWSYQFNDDHSLGITALAGLALMENGVARDDPIIRRATDVVVALAARSTQTYDITLAILFLARVQPGARGEHDELIRLLGHRLADGEQDGMWTYNVPMEPARQTGSRRKATSGSRRKGEKADDDPGLPVRNRQMRAPGSGDNSNTQFALLGIWAASRHEFDSDASLAAIERHFRQSQSQDGDWGYMPNQAGSNAMTCAGLMSLAITAARPEQAAKQNARARGAALAADPSFIRALSVVAQDARSIGPASDVYYLWSLERVCVALGLKDLNGLDWYARGAKELLRRQGDDGSWPESRWGRLPDTCLALLFLRKANLAFELDRVLKLPNPEREKALAKAAEVRDKKDKPAPKQDGSSGEDVSVIVKATDDARFPEITMDFEVKKANGEPLLDASRTDFRVTEYNETVEIQSFQGPHSSEVRPTTVVLVVDHSKSMEDEDRIGSLKKAVATFLKVIPEGSRIAVVAFSSDVELVCPFTTDRAKVQQAIDGLVPEGATRYYDAVATAIKMLSKETGRRAVLALTDGEDTFSQDASLDSVILGAQKASVPVNTLGLGSEDEIESEALRRLATDTRGGYYPARQADQLRMIYEELAKSLKQSYSLVYKTNHKVQDGTLRPVRVYYRASQKAGEAALYIPGMVVQTAGWSWLFLLLIAGLGTLALLPGRLARKPRSS